MKKGLNVFAVLDTACEQVNKPITIEKTEIRVGGCMVCFVNNYEVVISWKLA